MTENSDATNLNVDEQKDERLENGEKLQTEDQIELEANSKTIRLARVEYRMFFHLAAMFTIISFVYSFGRILKDAAVLSKQHQSSIFGLKILILFLSVFVMGFIQKGLMKHPLTKIFNVILFTFAFIFILLGVAFLPLSKKIQIDFFWARDLFADGKYKIRGLDAYCPLVLIFNEWTSSLVYISCEMFGSLVLSYMFMTFTNSLTTPLQSSRFVPLLYVLSNVALLASGVISSGYNKLKKGWSYETAERSYYGFFVVSGVLVLLIWFLKYRLENCVVNKPIFIKKSTKKKGPKQKVGFMEGIMEMAKSKLLLNISMIVLFYAISTNLIESSYKSGLSAGADFAGEEKSSYSTTYNSGEQIFVAIMVIVVLLSPFPKLIQKKGWIFVAIWSPIFTLFSAVMVFGLAFYNFPYNKEGDKNIIFKSFGAVGKEPYFGLENLLGAFSVGLMKIHKYAAFDITKEAISMQIDSSLRARYKGIFDGVFGKLGKSVGSFYGSIMTNLFNCRDIRKVGPIGGGLVIFNCIIWFFSVFYLHRKYTESVKNNAPIDVDLFGEKKKTSQTTPEEPTKTVTADI
ncbi:ADP,ATP carrier protein 2 [Nosema granulosis]|uniref:ADP,ATP carrier protein n=1 Tax=Nosema granulosis TaxID=83296 RepID=A0A9P6H1C3_9MICR|nr:ADP,ATP carrier protein 2 [Nosema granulosis]